MKSIYLRPNMPKIEEPDHLVRLQEWFGEQYEIYVEMNIETFNYLLGRLGISPNSRIITFDEPQYLYGYRIIINNHIRSFYVDIHNFYELT